MQKKASGGGVRSLCARVALAGLFAAAASRRHAEPCAADDQAEQLTFANSSGVHRTFTTAGAIDADNPFFQDLGTNGRTCFTCHRPAQAWTITPEDVPSTVRPNAGLDPIFRTNDGSNCEGADSPR